MKKFVHQLGFEEIEAGIISFVQRQNELDTYLLSVAKRLVSKIILNTQDEVLKTTFLSECYKRSSSNGKLIKQETLFLETIFAEAILRSQNDHQQSRGLLIIRTPFGEKGEVGRAQYHSLFNNLAEAVLKFNQKAGLFLFLNLEYSTVDAPNIISVVYTCDYKNKFPWAEAK